MSNTKGCGCGQAPVTRPAPASAPARVGAQSPFKRVPQSSPPRRVVQPKK